MKLYFRHFIAVSIICLCNIKADSWNPPSDYYDSATGHGAALKSQLQSIMSSGHIQRNYGSYRYSAALEDQDLDNPSNLFLCYNRASVDSTWDSGITWNREHIWPQSRQPGEASNSSTGNLGDPFALRPCNPSINSSRNNKPYAGATLTGSYRSNGSYYFPGDADKGDIARSLFYSATRWSSQGLTLVNGFPSGYQMGDLASLLRWHYMDPPDTFERRRNHTIYSKVYNPSYYTNNRNAYIDHPEFVWSVFGGDDNDTMIYLGSTHDSDGSSSVAVDLGGISIRSAGTLPSVTVTLSKIGDDGTYYRIIESSNVTCLGIPSGRAFDYGTQSLILTIKIDEIPTQAGQYTERVVIDNLDVCGNSPTGCGSNDADDVITVTYMVLAADLTDDGVVNIDDLMEIAANWLDIVPELNIEDGIDDETDMINLVDFSALAGEWNI